MSFNILKEIQKKSYLHASQYLITSLQNPQEFNQYFKNSYF